VKRIALIFLALQLISSVVCVYSCKLAFASAIDQNFFRAGEHVSGKKAPDI